ncbi:MAG: TonB family protein, partial [Candidatus Eremiobacteraeota bacterium]|nr:TonB family protein [Candidatus Eremiobacteraeota bacterium]
VVVPTPPPPTPTPPPPTPQPKSTPPPVKQTNPPPVQKLKVHPPKTTTNSNTGPSQAKYKTPAVGSENGVPNGNSAVGKPAPVAATGKPAPPAPTAAPTTPPTPKPQCAVPNAPAAIKGQAVEPDYPDMARQEGATGTAEVKVTLTGSGVVQGTSIYKSAGNASLDQAAIKAAQQTAYTPDIVNCVQTAGSYLFEADFTGQ